MPRVSADVHQLAAKMRHQLLTREDMVKLRAVKWYPAAPANPVVWGLDAAHSVFDRLRYTLGELPAEGYKIFPWVVREFKNGNINHTNYRHAMDILNQAIHWFVFSYEHNKPLPDYMSREFGFPQMEAWVYEMNARDVDTSKGIEWPNSTTVYTFDDGWHIDAVGPDDLPQEGELCGHCVGGQGYQNAVRDGHSTIFSLRDPKGAPHVTAELSGDRAVDVTRGYGEADHHDRDIAIEQEYGKSDSKPIPEYQDRMDAWYDHLRDQGWNVYYIEDQDPEYEEYMDDTTVYPPTHEGVGDYYHTLQHDPWRFQEDEEPQLEYDHGHAVLRQRARDYIGHPTQTYQHADGQTYPSIATTPNLFPAIAQTLTALWGNRLNDDQAQEYAQAYIAAAHHTAGWGGMPEVEPLVQYASEWVAKKKQQKPKANPNRPSLFEPDDYFAQPIPRPVQTFLHYLTAYHFASLEKPADRPHHNVSAPIMPEEGTYPFSEFPAYFGGLEEASPQFFKRDWLDSLTQPNKAVQAHLLDKLIKMGSDYYDEPHGEPYEWSLEDAGDDDLVQMPEMSSDMQAYVQDRAFEQQMGWANRWPMVIAWLKEAKRRNPNEPFESLRQGALSALRTYYPEDCDPGWADHLAQVDWEHIPIKPPAPTTEVADTMWPDVLPWGEKEQNYYRTAAQQIMWHISPYFNRKSITEHGLNWEKSDPANRLPNTDSHDENFQSREWPRGQYLFTDLEEVLGTGSEEDDVWEVDVRDLSLESDPYLSQPNEHAVYVSEPIPPERLTLVRAGAGPLPMKESAEWGSPEWGAVGELPFLYNPDTARIVWGTPNGYHKEIYDDLHQRGEEAPSEYWHGRYFPSDGAVMISGGSYTYMPPADRLKFKEMIRRNAPQNASVSPQDAPGGSDMESWGRTTSSPD